jgi:hypothetical protein
MFESMHESLKKWNTRYTDRAKLQHAYIAVSVGLLLIAGVIGLIDRGVGQNILMVAIISAGAFVTNAVVWALLQSAVLSRLGLRKSPARKK